MSCTMGVVDGVVEGFVVIYKHEYKLNYRPLYKLQYIFPSQYQFHAMGDPMLLPYFAYSSSKRCCRNLGMNLCKYHFNLNIWVEVPE